MLEAAFITQLDAAVCFGGVFIPAHHTAKPESCLERNPTPQPQHLTKREEGTLGRRASERRFCFQMGGFGLKVTGTPLRPMKSTSPRKPWYRILYVQVLIAVALGIVMGAL